MEGNRPQFMRDTSRRDRDTVADSNIYEAIQTIEAFVQKENWPVRIRGMWTQVKQVALLVEKGNSSENTSSADIREIKAQVHDLTVILRNMAKDTLSTQPKAISYAGVLCQPAQMLQVAKEMPVPARQTRELIVAPGAKSPSQKQHTGLELVQDLNSRLQCDVVVAARPLPSGDTLITFENGNAKGKWAKSPEITEAFSTNSRVRAREFTVMAHRVRVATVDTRDQQKAIEGIYKQNPKLRGSIEITRVGWARKVTQQRKKIASLYLGIAEPEQANLLIEQGLLYGSELHDCEVYYGNCQVTQCFRCYTYGHMAKHCQRVVRCGFCAAAGHKSNDCPKQGDPQAYRCAACKGNPKHTAWARECPTRQAQVADARQAYLSRPAQFQVHTKPTLAASAANTPTTPIAPATVFSSQILTDFTCGQAAEGFIGNITEDADREALRKRRRGKPATCEILRRPPPRARDIQDAFANIPEITFSI
jgi:hypothetical protein